MGQRQAFFRVLLAKNKQMAAWCLTDASLPRAKRVREDSDHGPLVSNFLNPRDSTVTGLPTSTRVMMASAPLVAWINFKPAFGPSTLKAVA